MTNPSNKTTRPVMWETASHTTALETRVFSVERVERSHPERTGRRACGTFWTISPADWVNILAMTPSREIVLVRQYRHGTNQITLEIPGGAVDKGEDPIRAAQRELREETGYTAKRWEVLGRIAVNPAMMTNHCTTLLALGAEQTDPQQLDEHEDIVVERLPVADFFDAIDQGVIDHGIVVSAAYYLRRHLEQATSAHSKV